MEIQSITFFIIVVSIIIRIFPFLFSFITKYRVNDKLQCVLVVDVVVIAVFLLLHRCRLCLHSFKIKDRMDSFFEMN